MKWKIQNLVNGMPIGEWDLPNDSVIVYDGLYGAPRSFTWYMDIDKSSEIKISPIMRLAKGAPPNTSIIDDFTIKRTYFDNSKSKFVVYGEAEVFERLSKTMGITHKVFSSNISHPKDAISVLKEILSYIEPEVKPVIENGLEGEIGYTQFSFNSSVSVLDVITQICLDNSWEWYLGSDKLIVGKSIDYLSKNFNIGNGKYNLLSSPMEEESIKTISKGPFEVVSMPAKSNQPGIGWEKTKRVLWVKFYMGEVYGDLMVFNTVGRGGYVDPELFRETLNGGLIKQRYDEWLQTSQINPSSIMIGKCIEEPSGSDSTFIDEYRMPDFGGDIKQFAKKHDDIMFEEKYKNVDKQNYVYQPKMTTPYAGDGVGVLFPHNSSNKVLFTPDFARELSLAGPSYFGSEMDVPKRASYEDFRLQLPGGSVLYVASDGELVIQPSDSSADEIPTNENKMQIYMDPATNLIQIKQDDNTVIEIDGTDINILAGGTNTFAVGGNEISIDSGGIDIKATNINIQGTTKIQGTTQMNGNLKVNGQIDMLAGKTVSLPNIDSAVIKKIPPGP